MKKIAIFLFAGLLSLSLNTAIANCGAGCKSGDPGCDTSGSGEGKLSPTQIQSLIGRHYDSKTNTLKVQDSSKTQYNADSIKVSKLSASGSWALSDKGVVYSYCTACGGYWLYRSEVSPGQVGL